MHEKDTIEKIGDAIKAVDNANALNRHIITCVTIILVAMTIGYTACNMYATSKMYDYELVQENRNFNINSEGGQ